jgi:hypothetical protein
MAAHILLAVIGAIALLGGIGTVATLVAMAKQGHQTD